MAPNRGDIDAYGVSFPPDVTFCSRIVFCFIARRTVQLHVCCSAWQAEFINVNSACHSNVYLHLL